MSEIDAYPLVQSGPDDAKVVTATQVNIGSGQDKVAMDTYIRGGTLAISGAVVTPIIYNVTCTSANTEYSQALPANSKGFIVKARSKVDDIKIAFTSGESGTNYMTISGGYAYNNDKVYASLTLYFQSPSAGAVVEILVES